MHKAHIKYRHPDQLHVMNQVDVEVRHSRLICITFVESIGSIIHFRGSYSTKHLLFSFLIFLQWINYMCVDSIMIMLDYQHITAFLKSTSVTLSQFEIKDH